MGNDPRRCGCDAPMSIAQDEAADPVKDFDRFAARCRPRPAGRPAGFNPRPRVGGGMVSGYLPQYNNSFNPRPRVGGGVGSGCLPQYDNSFNPRPRVARRRERRRRDTPTSSDRKATPRSVLTAPRRSPPPSSTRVWRMRPSAACGFSAHCPSIGISAHCRGPYRMCWRAEIAASSSSPTARLSHAASTPHIRSMISIPFGRLFVSTSIA